MTLDYAYTTNPGSIREKNEDNLWCAGKYLSEDHLSEGAVSGQIKPDSSGGNVSASFCVFDGLGGEKRGETASYLAAACFDDCNNESDKDFSYICDAMNRAVCDYADEHQLGHMGSTAAMVRFRRKGSSADICNIGDSRIYLMRDNTLRQLSIDHVLYHPFTGMRMLTQSLGMDAEQMVIEPYTTEVPVRTGDIFIVCSDGLTDCCSDTVIKDLICRSTDCKEAVTQLEKAALTQGAPDNITVIICQVS